MSRLAGNLLMPSRCVSAHGDDVVIHFFSFSVSKSALDTLDAFGAVLILQRRNLVDVLPLAPPEVLITLEKKFHLISQHPLGCGTILGDYGRP